MDISDFKMPEAHPFNMLEGYKRAYEKESVLALILIRCIKAGGIIPVQMAHNHPTMVKDGLLEKVANREYELTEKALGLLYSQYAS